MDLLKKEFRTKRSVWFSLLLTVILFISVFLTQKATTETRDPRSQAAASCAAGCSKNNDSFSVTAVKWKLEFCTFGCQTKGEQYSNVFSIGGTASGVKYTWRAEIKIGAVWKFWQDGEFTGNGGTVNATVSKADYHWRFYDSSNNFIREITVQDSNTGNSTTSITTNLLPPNMTLGSQSKVEVADYFNFGNRFTHANLSGTTSGCSCPTPTMNSLNASPNPINRGQSTTISWTSSNATSVTITPTIGSVGTSGNRSVTPQTTTTYTAQAFGPGGSSQTLSRTVTVNQLAPPPPPPPPPANPQPSVNMRANNQEGPITIAYNSSATLTWVVSNATSCTASNGWSGSKSASGGSQSTGNLTSSKTYTLTCSGAGGSRADSVIVNVQGQAVQPPPPPPPPPIGGFVPPPPPPSSGGKKPPPPPASKPPLVGSKSPAVTNNDQISIKFAKNAFLNGRMTVEMKFDGTGFTSKFDLDKASEGIVVTATGVLSKNQTYTLRISSRNSLVIVVPFTFTNSTVINVPVFATGDFNRDNIINETDLDQISRGIEKQDLLFDTNWDGTINSIDYSQLLINLGKKGT